ncbi:MAG: molybdenum cofactor guanylyltransferase [Bacteroidales bacterium]|nr:molybdenum cofactor guanylyltransferase [Bacteroidales bacterium]
MVNDTTGILLAGGNSSRMETEKGLVLLNGKPLVEYALESLQSVFKRIIISANNDAFDGYGWPVVKDVYEGCGPMAGIFAGMQASQTNYVFVLSYDMPFVTTGLIHSLLNKRADFEAVLPFCNNFPIPVCACYNRTILPRLENSILSKKLKVSQFVEGIRYHYLIPDQSQNDQFYSVNTPSDLQTAALRFAKS